MSSSLDEFFGPRPTQAEYQLGVDLKEEIAKHAKLPYGFGGWSKEAQVRWLLDQRAKQELADWRELAKMTETRVKTALASTVSAYLKKDGDWVTLVGGQRVWQKKISDYVGSVPWPGMPKRAKLYVEVKSISPLQDFDFKSRLVRRKKPRQPSQHEKLTAAHERGEVVWLALGWWDHPGMAPVVKQKQHGKKKIQHKLWVRDNLELTISLIDWQDWIENVMPDAGQLKQSSRDSLAYCSIFKNGRGHWELHRKHWARKTLLQPTPQGI